jgi:hypothetical protein
MMRKSKSPTLPELEPKYPTFIVEYRFKGQRWDVTFPAKSWEEAEARLRHISMGQVVGELKGAIEVRPKLLQRLLLWWHRK